MQSIFSPHNEILSVHFRAGHATAATEAATIRRLPPHPRARRLSGRPSCRIYLGRRAWILEFETICGGWMEPGSASGSFGPKALAFPTLASAVAYAEKHGFDYRIEPPARHSCTSVRRVRREQRLPRSWLPLLSSNARNGRLYHA